MTRRTFLAAVSGLLVLPRHRRPSLAVQFRADFSAFHRAIERAQARLIAFRVNAHQVEHQLSAIRQGQ